MNTKNNKVEFEDLQELLYEHLEITNTVCTIELSLNLFKFDDLTKCNKAAHNLNKFFKGQIVNAVMFQHDKPDFENVISSTFTATLPLSEKNFNLFIDLLILNLISANTIAFNNTIVIRTNKEKYLLKQSITIDH